MTPTFTKSLCFITAVNTAESVKQVILVLVGLTRQLSNFPEELKRLLGK